MFHQTPSHSLTLLSCKNQPTFRILPLILYSVRMAQYRPQHLGWVHTHRSGSAVFSGRLNDEAKVLDLMDFKVTLGDVNLQACIL